MIMYIMAARKKRVEVPISSARARLFQLTDLVRNSDDTIVVFDQRGTPERVALVREARLAYLEARVAELERRESPVFRLQGSLGSNLDDASLDRVLRDIRHEWAPEPAVATHRAGRRRRANR
jgi:hypothetical protein